VTDAASVDRWLRERHAAVVANGTSIEDLRDYHVAVGGFVDVRPHAVVCTAKSDADGLSGRVARFRDEEALRDHVASVEPYTFFATSGVLAVLFRLRALWTEVREAMIELGTLHEYRWHMPRDAVGHTILVPGIVESLRQVSEGLEKTTGTERLSGQWGYERRAVPDRRGSIPGINGPT
jgi:hypothetical protein